MEKFQYTPENLRKMQLVEIDILRELDEICRRNGINYVIDAGTLLGAVRHGGFIPWDDDIDVRMLRKDYDRFCEICKKELGENYFLQTYKTDPGYRWGYARILRKGTVFKRRGQDMIKSQNGIFIDVFPNDNLPDKLISRNICTFVSLLCRKMLYSEVGAKNVKNIFSRLGFKVLNIFPKPMAYTMLEWLINTYKDQHTERVRCYGWGSTEETIGFDRKWFVETRDMQFENLIVKAPVETHEFLVRSFGNDYMTPPPVKEREPKHTAEYVKFPDE